MRIFLAILLLTIAAGAGAAGENPSSQNLLFILDASGSMWGRIDGTPKISVAKEVMSGLVADLPDDAKAGLTAYGHRRKGDCSDIQSLVGLGPLDRDTMIDKIQGLNPKGKTPITASVKQAIDQLRQTEESASVVLVSDGLESCGGDPCEAVKAAKKSGVDFTLHVVGFDLDDADPAQLQCMAEAGGGQFYTAANADELTNALEKAVEVKPGLVLTVVSNGEPTPARATAFSAATRESARHKVKTVSLGESAAGKPANPRRIPLASGTYEVEVHATELSGDRSKTLTELAIPDKGQIERTVDFSDGKLSVKLTANGELQKGRVDVFAAGDDDRVAKRYPKDDPEENPRVFRLVPGDYDLRVEAHGISAPDQWLRGVTVTAGETVSKTVDFASGKLSVKLTANGELQEGRVDVFAAGDDDRIAKRYPKDDSQHNPRTVRLPPGDYDIKVNVHGISAPRQWLRGVTVTAGETVSKTVDFSAGKLSVKLTANGELQEGRVDVFAAADDDRIVKRYTKDDPGDNPRTFRLPPGDYDIKGYAHGISAPHRDITGLTVTAGETVSRTVDFKPMAKE